MKNNKKQKLSKRLRNKYKLVILNEETLEQVFSLILSPLNVITWISVVVVSVMVLTISAIVFTPIKEFIPGYADVNTKKIATYAALKVDSLEQVVMIKDRYLQNLKRIIQGDSLLGYIDTAGEEMLTMQTIHYERSEEDSMLREKIEKEEFYNLTFEGNASSSKKEKQVFFKPVNGVISEKFSPEIEHFGIDVLAKENEPVLAVADGTVVFADWTNNGGYEMHIMHENNMVSIYKHNSKLIKKTGHKVFAGDPVAIIGNTGELTTGPHLHFELWINGTPVDPLQYLNY